MTTFAYRARDLNGLLVIGQMEADAAEPVKSRLAEQGLIPLTVHSTRNSIDFNLSAILTQRVKTEEIMLFTRQFHTLFKAGMDIKTLLDTLARQTKNKFFSESLLKIKGDIASGGSLGTAFSKHPKIFNELYINMLATGEEAGILDEVLEQISTILEKETHLKSSVKSATLYPKIVMFVLVGASVVLMTVVVPKFTAFYANYDAELPLPTRIMIGASDLLTNYWYLAAAIAGGAWLAFKKWVSTTRGRYLFDIFKWKLPVFGMLGQKVANARFANILGALYRAGVSITRSLEITSKTIGNGAFSRNILIIKNDVEKGKGIADSMRRMQFVSPLLIEATAIGEKSGALDEMYNSVGSHLDMEVSHTLKNLTTLLEPMLLFMVFGMVTIFALAIFLPIWNLSKVVMH